MSYEIGAFSKTAPALDTSSKAATGVFTPAKTPVSGGSLATPAAQPAVGRMPGEAALDGIRRQRAIQAKAVAVISRKWSNCRKQEARAKAATKVQKHAVAKDGKLAIKLAKALVVAEAATKAAFASLTSAKRVLRALDEKIKAMTTTMPVVPPPSPATAQLEAEAKADNTKAEAEVKQAQAEVQQAQAEVPSEVVTAAKESGTPINTTQDVPENTPPPPVPGEEVARVVTAASNLPTGVLAAGAVVGGFVLWKLFKG